jgi:hypothetical protein
VPTWTWFIVVGLAFDVAGAWVLARGLFISEEQAVELTATRFAGETLEENLRHPQAQDRLKQSRAAKWGMGLLIVGFVLQVVGGLVAGLSSN